MNLPPPPKAQWLGDIPGYTSHQMQADRKQCWAQALEEAAQVADERANGENDAQWCADRIRSLK